MYESYTTIKAIHIVTVFISLGIFAIRGFMMLLAKGDYQHRIWRLTSAFNDSLLLVLGLYLSYLNSIVWQLGWFQEKMLFLVLYIVLGMLALKRLKNMTARRICLLAAFICAGHMLQLARYNTTWFFS